MSATQKETLTLVRGGMPTSRKRTGGISFQKETFTPAQAEKELEVSRAAGFINRNQRTPAIKRMAKEMREGRYFVDTGETLKFSHNKESQEVLIDGQHRLEACLLSGKTCSFWVSRNVPLEAFRYLDQGAGREVKDILFIEDEKWRDNNSALSVAGQLLWKRAITGDPTKRPIGEDNESEGNKADAIRLSFGDLPDVFASYKVRLNAGQADRVGPKSLFLFLLYEWRLQDDTLAECIADYIGNRYEQTPPSKYFAWAMQYVDGVREDAAKSSGRITKGRHKDVVDETLRAWTIAWNMQRESQRRDKKFAKATFQKRLRETSGVPLAQ